MKAHILKLSGAKDEKAFYKMFPTQESFMAKHGKELHQLLSMQNGGDTNKNGIPDYLEAIPPNQYQGQGNVPRQFGSGFPMVGPMEGPQVNSPLSNIPRPQLPTEPLQEEMDASKSLIKPTTPKQLANEAVARNQQIIGASSPTSGASTSTSPWDTVGNMIPGAGKVVGGIKALKAERDALKGAKQWNQVSAAALKASQTTDVNARTDIADTQRRLRQELTPTIDANVLFPTYGVGTNVLTRHGGKMNHGGEIMNTFAPGDIYNDLGYEPLSESDQVKSFAHGGKAAGGFDFASMLGAGAGSSFDFAGAGNAAGNLTSNLFGNNAGAQIGGGVADIAGMIPGVGPIAGAIAKPVFSAIGGLLDRNPKKTEAQQRQMMGNVGNMSGVTALKGFQNEYSGVFEDGGNLTNPQLITKFNGVTQNDLENYFNDMDTLRTGGNIRSNSVGDIETVSGGYLEPISYNPYTPGTGITSMIRGQSHDESNGRHSGVIMDYAGNQVEAERGEPISERQDGGNVGNTSAVIAGDQTFNELGATLYPELAPYKGQKVKNINAEIAKEDAKNNRFSKKNTSMLKDFEVKTPFDKLTMNSLTLNQKGIDAQYKHNADKVNKLLEYQDAVNKTAEERGVDAGALSRGKLSPIKKAIAKTGDKLLKDEDTNPPKGARGNVDPNLAYTQPGIMPGALDQTPVGIANTNPMFQSPEAYAKYKQETEKAYADPETAKQLVNYFLTYEGPDQEDVRGQMNKQKTYADMVNTARGLATDYKPGRYHINTGAFGKPAATVPAVTPTPVDPNYQVTPYHKAGWETIAGQILPWMRKTPGEPLLGDQLAGEMYAMSNNQVEPVQGRFYHPELDVPYDISLQDQQNENQADFNSMQRAVGNNPEALAALAAQKYGANSKVLGEQFRLNQAKKDQVYSQNRATLNDAQLKNLGIADQQYVRQAQAKSNTKQAMQEALNSVASKIGQNRLENRTLQTYSNLFPQYSYDKNFNILNTGAPAQFNIDQGIYNTEDRGITHVPVYDKKGKVIGMKPVGETDKKAEEKKARQGNIIKAFKGY